MFFWGASPTWVRHRWVWNTDLAFGVEPRFGLHSTGKTCCCFQTKKACGCSNWQSGGRCLLTCQATVWGGAIAQRRKPLGVQFGWVIQKKLTWSADWRSSHDVTDKSEFAHRWCISSKKLIKSLDIPDLRAIWKEGPSCERSCQNCKVPSMSGNLRIRGSKCFNIVHLIFTCVFCRSLKCVPVFGWKLTFVFLLKKTEPGERTRNQSAYNKVFFHEVKLWEVSKAQRWRHKKACWKPDKAKNGFCGAPSAQLAFQRQLPTRVLCAPSCANNIPRDRFGRGPGFSREGPTREGGDSCYVP